jgi:hypothetical protein
MRELYLIFNSSVNYFHNLVYFTIIQISTINSIFRDFYYTCIL